MKNLNWNKMIFSSNENRRGLFYLFTIIISHFMYNFSFAQESVEKHRTYINIEFTQSEIQNTLVATLTTRIKGERGRKKVAEAEIEFYNVSDTIEILLGKAITNMQGLATLEIAKNQMVLSNSDGEFLYKAVFRGNENYADVSKSVDIKVVDMKISFIEIDSIKNIKASAYELGANGENIPVDEDVAFYVPRQFSLLKIGEAELEEGEGTIEFPITLPGDSIGNLKIIAKIEESDDFGTVESIAIKDWGNPRPPVIIEKRRGLGDTDAPLWMVYTLIILLSAVWFHYLYIMYVLLVVKQKGKNPGLVSSGNS